MITYKEFDKYRKIVLSVYPDAECINVNDVFYILYKNVRYRRDITPDNTLVKDISEVDAWCSGGKLITKQFLEKLES